MKIYRDIASICIDDKLTVCINWRSLWVPIHIGWTNRNGIPWNSGDVPYEKGGEILRNNLQHADIIYVKGLEKIKWLKNFIREFYNIVNLDDYDYPSLRKFRTKSLCPPHCPVSEFNYAMENEKLLKSWLHLNQTFEFWYIACNL